MGRFRRLGWRGLTCILLIVAAWVDGPAASDAPPPDPLPWNRTYVATGEPPETWASDLFYACLEDQQPGLRDNGVTGAPTIGVIGDSVDSVTRGPALLDPLHRWVFGTHCGENYGTALTEGRLDAVLGQQPDVLMAGIGSNNFSRFYAPVPELMPWFHLHFDLFLQRTDAVPCRVIFNVPHQYPAVLDDAQRAVWDGLADEANRIIGSTDHRAHPNVQIVDWDAVTKKEPDLLTGDGHLTHAGINKRINLTLAASRQCFAPDTPQGVRAVAGNGTATVWWDPLPPEQAVTAYRVTASTGQVVTTRHPTVNVAGLTNGVPVTFSVTAENRIGPSTPSLPSASVTPTGLGARFHPVAPTRALDTRVGVGGWSGPLAPRETRQLSLAGVLPAEAANASAVALNVTAVGATEPTFITVWPGDQSRPMTSSANPRPGLAAAPAFVTTRAGPGPTVQLFNNAGDVHLVVDVVGWYDQPGTGTGALFQSLTPVRALDSRRGIGGRSVPFGSRESFDVRFVGLPADASAVVLNLTSTNTTSSGFVTAFPTGSPRPTASNLNPQTGLTRANLTVAKLGTGGAVTLFNNSAVTDLVVDLVGYYTAPGAAEGGSEYFPLTPERAFDSRAAIGGLVGPLPNSTPTGLRFAGRGSLPAASAMAAVDANITVTGPSAGGHTSLWPSGPIPATSSLNYGAGEDVPNRMFAALTGGESLIWSSASSIHYVVDVSGWFGPVLGTEAPASASTPTTAATPGSAPSGPRGTEPAGPPRTPVTQRADDRSIGRGPRR